ncbi:MAG: sensor histidine kinase [Bradymonadia bacterium]
MTEPVSSPQRRLRWLQGALLLAAAATLLITVWAMYSAVMRTSDAVARSQGDQLLRALHHQRVLPLNTRFLSRVARDLSDVGLRRVVVYAASGEVKFHIDTDHPGTPPPVLEEVRISARPGSVQRLDNGRLRVMSRPELPPPGGGGPPLGARMPDGPPRGPTFMDTPPPPGGARVRNAPAKSIMIEFEPTTAMSLQVQGEQTLMVGAFVALLLLGASVGVWRLSVKAELAQQAQERDRRLAMLGEMSAILAHEIRNPLASLKGHAQLLSEGLGEAPRKKRKADFVIKEAIRLEKLCEDLLSLVRSGQIERVETDPKVVVEVSAESVSAERFTLHLDEAPSHWPLDPGRMQQVLINLMRNAMQAAPEEAPTEVTAKLEGGQLIFVVRDHGPGIPADVVDKIFEPFHTNKVKGGTGLGLAVARRVVEQHGGTIVTHNHPEGGAVFTITIPRP